MILDEATAHLDSESEAATQRALKTALADRTSRVIANAAAPATAADAGSQPRTPVTATPLMLFSRGFRPSTVRDFTNSRALPSGYLEQGESVIDGAVREASEEVGVAIDPSDLTFVHVPHYRAPGSEGRIGSFFLTEKWAGDPWNREPDKCARLIWSDPAQPPAAVPYTTVVLRQIAQGQPFSLDGWPSPSPPEA